MKRKKLALVLSGGGFRGAFQVGVLQYLKENWQLLGTPNPELKFDLVAGVSAGSLNGLLVASQKFDELTKLWNDVAEHGVEEIYTSDFINTSSDKDTLEFKINLNSLFALLIPNIHVHDIKFWEKVGLLISSGKRRRFFEDLLVMAQNDLYSNLGNFKAIADNTPLRNKLKAYAKISDIQDCIYMCGSVSLNDGDYHSFKHTDFTTNEDFLNGVLASTSMPIIWPPVLEIYTSHKQRKNLVDGGIRNISPLGDIIREINRDYTKDSYLIIIINCSSGHIEYENFTRKNIVQIALRSLYDITMSEIFNNDIRQFINTNFILEQVMKEQPQTIIHDYDFDSGGIGKPIRHFQAIVIQPAPGVLGDPLVANKNLIDRRVLHGRQKADMALNQILETEGKYNFILS